MPGRPAIKTFSLTKVYPGGGGCRDIILEAEAGEVFYEDADRPDLSHFQPCPHLGPALGGGSCPPGDRLPA